MKQRFLIIWPGILFTLLLINNLSGQYCLFDSINDRKLVYDEDGKLDLIMRRTIWFPPYDSVMSIYDLNYNTDSLLESLVGYVISYNGDTLSGPGILKTFEFENGLLSKINEYDDVVYDDFVWEGNKVMEYKYYYFWGDTLPDSSQTRILQFTYLNNNIYHFLYYEIASGEVYSNYYFTSYDNKINPYYWSEMSLVDGDILDYVCVNNWKSTSSGMHRTINYNQYNYPIYIFTDWNNGNLSYDTLSYDCTNSIFHRCKMNEEEVELIPNPCTDYFSIRSHHIDKIKEIHLLDLNGVIILNVVNMDRISVQNLEPGIYIVECIFDNNLIRKKIVVYTN